MRMDAAFYYERPVSLYPNAPSYSTQDGVVVDLPKHLEYLYLIERTS
jgi:hypothetical protein